MLISVPKAAAWAVEETHRRPTMPTHSIYEFTCLCGRNFQTDDPSEIRCPDCGRALVLEWRPTHPGGICAAHIEEARP